MKRRFNIDALPDLCDALKALTDIASESVEYSDWPELQKAIADARAALEKAEIKPSDESRRGVNPLYPEDGPQTLYPDDEGYEEARHD